MSDCLSGTWITDTFQWGRIDLRSRSILHSKGMVWRINKGILPCYAPEVDHPGWSLALPAETWEMPLCDPDTAHERAGHIRGEVFSAKLGRDNFTHTSYGLWVIE